MEWVTIDGSYGEGGGQILRTSLCLSALTGKPLHIMNIRAGRKNPGLRPQHLTAVRAVAMICQGHVEGAEIGSSRLRFIPVRLQSGEWALDVSGDRVSAGSIPLIIQTVFPALAFAPSPSTLRVVRGGTHVPFSPPFDYLVHIFLPMVKKMGVKGKMRLVKAGWFPRGGGEVLLTVYPTTEGISPIRLIDRGELKRLYILSALSNLKRSIALRQANRAVNRLLEMGFRQSAIEVDIQEFPSPSQGTVVFIAAEFEDSVAGFSALGEIGKPAERVADEAVEAFFAYWHTDAPIDPHLADQIVLFMALAEGRSIIRTSILTRHTLTNIWVIERFLPVRFEVQGAIGKVATLSVQGIGQKLRQN